VKALNPPKLARRWFTAVSRRNDRLYPSRLSGRFYALTTMRSHVEVIINAFLAHRPDLSLVDFGCGRQPYRPILEPYVGQYIGVDLPGNEHADSYVSPNGTVPLGDGFADIVLSTFVLEHVDNPLGYLRECYRILKQNGLLVLSAPGYWAYHPDPTDFWRWTSSGLKKIVEASGFRLVQMRGIMGLGATAVQLFQDAAMGRVPRFVRPVFVLIAQSVIELIDRLYTPSKRSKDACLYVAVASKEKPTQVV